MSSSPEPTPPLSPLISSTRASASPATLTSTPAPITTSTSPKPYPPMTTPWSTPASCTWTYDVVQEPQPGTPGPIAWLDMYPVPNASTLSCYPSGMFYGGRTGVFSPGTCPNGWTTVSVRQNTNEGKSMTTTTAVCCSSEYTLDGSYCKREVPTVLAIPMIYNSTASTPDVVAHETSTLVSATLAVHTIKALFREKDKDLLGLTYEGEIRDDGVTKKGGLSMNARIGIGIGATLGGLIVIGLGLWLFLRKRGSRTRRTNAMSDVDAADSGNSAEPPPAYEFTERNSIEEDDGEADVRDGEISVLRAQKASIQRRIDELESVEANEDDTPSR